MGWLNGDRQDEAQSIENRALWWLIAGRMAVACVLLAASALLARFWMQNGVDHVSFHEALPIALAGMALSLIYVLALRFRNFSHTTQSGTQFFFDVLLVTWLVWTTGDVHSPYAALYIIVIAITSFYLGARGALLISVGCAFCYTTAMLSLATGWLMKSGVETVNTPLAEAVWAIGFNDVGYLVVGLLAARLSGRQARSDVQLIEATSALATLRALHERIVESIRSGVITTDLERRIYTVNAAAEELIGYVSEDLRGKDVSIIFGDITEQIDDSLRSAADDAASPRYESECLTPEGFRVRLGYSVSPLSAENGETTGLVITFQDLTDIRAMEETSRRQERLSAVGRVAAGIAHEIRNPLAAMRGSIQVLKAEMPADSAQSELMEIVLRESDRLNRIITDFLTYARPRTVSLVECDLREPLRETFTLLRHSPEMLDGHQLEEALPDEPIRALADEAAIKQVFWNLSRNALNAMPDGGTLRAELERAGQARVRITFTDTGRGMSPAQVERLFEPFSSSTTGGTGLGLSIVYQIVRDHGGTINVRSREGHGTTITVELPQK